MPQQGEESRVNIVENLRAVTEKKRDIGIVWYVFTSSVLHQLLMTIPAGTTKSSTAFSKAFYIGRRSLPSWNHGYYTCVAASSSDGE